MESPPLGRRPNDWATLVLGPSWPTLRPLTQANVKYSLPARRGDNILFSFGEILSVEKFSNRKIILFQRLTKDLPKRLLFHDFLIFSGKIPVLEVSLLRTGCKHNIVLIRKIFWGPSSVGRTVPNDRIYFSHPI